MKRPAKDLRLSWIHDETGLHARLPDGREVYVTPGNDDVEDRHSAEDREMRGTDAATSAAVAS